MRGRGLLLTCMIEWLVHLHVPGGFRGLGFKSFGFGVMAFLADQNLKSFLR